MAALMEMWSGIGGGMLRDVLVKEAPTVLRADLYNAAALAAGGVVVVRHVLRSPSVAFMIAGTSMLVAQNHGHIQRRRVLRRIPT